MSELTPDVYDSAPELEHQLCEITHNGSSYDVIIQCVPTCGLPLVYGRSSQDGSTLRQCTTVAIHSINLWNDGIFRVLLSDGSECLIRKNGQPSAPPDTAPQTVSRMQETHTKAWEVWFGILD